MASTPAFTFSTAGTKFRVHLQPAVVPGFEEPATVYVNSPPGTIQAGPRDDTIHVTDAKGDRQPFPGIPLIVGASRAYKQPYRDARTGHVRTMPPHTGAQHEPVQANAQGHFDEVKRGTRGFSAAAAYATVRCVLDVWQHCFGHPIRWFFHERQTWLEIIPRVADDNCWSGEGFVEFGFGQPATHSDPLAENFDKVAHETGHLILKSIIGNHVADRKTLSYRAHEEAAADLVSLVAAMHFPPVIDQTLRATKGRLLSRNLLSQIGESRDPDPRSRRALSNTERLRPLSPRIFAAWRDYDKHGYSLPFSGALFDILNAVYQDRLVAAGIGRPRPSRQRSIREGLVQAQREFPRIFPKAGSAFTEALLEARDYLGPLLARTWKATSVEGFSYERVAANVLAADSAVSGGRYGDTIHGLFTERGIIPSS